MQHLNVAGLIGTGPNAGLAYDAADIWLAGLTAVRGDEAVRLACRWHEDGFSVYDYDYTFDEGSKVYVVGGGKAAESMLHGLAAAAENQTAFLNGRLAGGLVTVPGEGNVRKIANVEVAAVRPTGFNRPTPAAVAASRRMRDIVRGANRRDLVICLLSGGASALLCDPVAPLDIATYCRLIDAIASGGATIEELNTFRRAVDSIKAGGLTGDLDGQVVTLAISDVLSGAPAMIGSGPTVPPAHEKSVMFGDIIAQLKSDARQIVERFVGDTALANVAYEAIDRRVFPGDMRAGDYHFVADNPKAVDAAGVRAVAHGYRYWMQSAQASGPSVERAAEDLVRMLEMASHTDSPQAVDCYIVGGEPTIELGGEASPGEGGRCSHLLALFAEKILSWDAWPPFCLFSGATDGEDGRSDAAGGWVDDRLMRRLSQDARLQRELHEAIRGFDSARFFGRCGHAIRTGPTGTNVCDVQVLLAPRHI